MTDQSDIDYRIQELAKIVLGEDLKLKITSATDETHWLNLNKTDLACVIYALVGNSYERTASVFDPETMDEADASQAQYDYEQALRADQEARAAQEREANDLEGLDPAFYPSDKWRNMRQGYGG